MRALTGRKEWQFFSVLPKADPLLAAGWWIVLLLRGVLPVIFAIATGMVVAAVQNAGSVEGGGIARPLELVGVVFVLLQILTPIHTALGANLGDRTAAWLYDRLTEACVRPPGMGHLEDPSLTSDLTVARDFDLGMTGPPLVLLDGLHRRRHGRDDRRHRVGGVVVRLSPGGRRSCSPAPGCRRTGCCAKAPSGGIATRPRSAPRSATPTTRIAWRSIPAGKGAAAVRARRLDDRALRRAPDDAAPAAVRSDAAAREADGVEPARSCSRPTSLVFWSLAAAASSGRLSLARARGLRAGGGRRLAARVRRLHLGARRRRRAGRRGPASRRRDGVRRRARIGNGARGRACRRARSAFATSRSPIPPVTPVLEHFDLTHPGRLVDRHRRPERRRQDDARQAALPSLRSAVGRDRSGRRRSARDRCRGVARADHRGLPGFHPPRDAAARQRRAVGRAGRGRPRRARVGRRRRTWPSLDTILARGYDGGTDLSGGQWQRVALARALAAVALGAGVVLLDEPTAQLDVRGEAEIFERILAATRHCTTILISHRFSTVRHADRICVLEHGRVVELGTHDELMALGGRYRTMFDLQAQRFNATRTRKASSMTSSPEATRRRRSAAGALVDVAAVQARLPARAGADAGRRSCCRCSRRCPMR